MAWRENFSVGFPSNSPNDRTLAGKDGELISVRALVEARLLEDLLEALAELPFAINPQLFHRPGNLPQALVEFPAYESWLPRIRAAVERAGLPPETVEVRTMLSAIHAG